MKPFPLKSGDKGTFSPLLFSIVLEFLVRAIRKKQKQKGYIQKKKKSNYSYLQMIMILYLKGTKDATTK
jgi:hypothetical protein